MADNSLKFLNENIRGNDCCVFCSLSPINLKLCFWDVFGSFSVVTRIMKSLLSKENNWVSPVHI